MCIYLLDIQHFYFRMSNNKKNMLNNMFTLTTVYKIKVILNYMYFSWGLNLKKKHTKIYIYNFEIKLENVNILFMSISLLLQWTLDYNYSHQDYSEQALDISKFYLLLIEQFQHAFLIIFCSYNF